MTNKIIFSKNAIYFEYILNFPFGTPRVSISWLYACNKSSYIRFVYSQYHVDWLKWTEQNVNNQILTQVSQLYVHVSFCLKVNRSWHNLPTGGHGHVICMLDTLSSGAIQANILVHVCYVTWPVLHDHRYQHYSLKLYWAVCTHT